MRAEFAEELEELIGFEMDALDLIIHAATLDGGPVHDGSGGCAERVAHVGLLKDFFGTGASAAIGEELFGGEVFALSVIDDVEEAKVDGVGEGHSEIQIPWGICISSIFDF